jgi:hypothetical protein
MEHEDVVHEFVGFRVLQLLTLVIRATYVSALDNENVRILSGCLNELRLFVYIVHLQLSIPGTNGSETLHAWLVQLERTLQSADTRVQRCGKQSRFNMFSRYMTTKGILKSTAEVKELLRQMVLFGLSFGFLQLRDVQEQARSMEYMREVIMDLNLADVTRKMSANVMHLNLADVQEAMFTHMSQHRQDTFIPLSSELTSYRTLIIFIHNLEDISINNHVYSLNVCEFSIRSQNA